MVGSMMQAASPHLKEAIERHMSSLKDLLAAANVDERVSVATMLEMAQGEANARVRVVNAEAKSFHDAHLKVIYFAAVLVVTEGKFQDGESEKLIEDLTRLAQ